MSPILFNMFVPEFVKEARGCRSGQPSTGKHIVDGLADHTFPVYSLTRCPTETWCLIHMAGHL